MQKFLIVTCFIALFASCKKTDTTNPGLEVAQNLADVAYGTDTAQVMDVYLPPGRSTATTKVMVMIHGGGWNSMDKDDFARYVDTMKRRLPNYAIFNINYRLASGSNNLFPTQEADVKAAIEFIYSKSAEYAISDKFVLVGASAGAHLALLQAYKYSSPIKIKAVVDFFGPADMVALYNQPGAQILVAGVVGGTPSTDSLLYASSSPINYVSATTPATIILHGGADPLVNPAQSDSLKVRLDSMHVISSIAKYPTQGHGWEGNDLYDSFNRIQVFLVANVD